MIVQILHSGCEIIGLWVGIRNVRRYFPKDKRNTAIEFELGHLRIECQLTPDFWDGRPEIRDPRLSMWLKSKRLFARAGRRPVSLAMVPSGVNCYKLEPGSRGGTRMDRSSPNLELEQP